MKVFQTGPEKTEGGQREIFTADEDLKSLLTKGKLDPEVLEDDEFIWRHV